MQPLSVVIVCRNEAGIIGKTLDSLSGLTDDIIVYDNGSTDGTIDLVKQKGGKLVPGEWMGFGRTKKAAAGYARYDWILSLDADESISEELKNGLLALDLSNDNIVYDLRFRNYLGNKALRFGEWGGDSHIRLFNRRKVQWDDAPVHEKLVIPGDIKIITLPGHVLHFTARDIEQYEEKLKNYASLNAEKYQLQGRSSSWWLRTFSAPFSFVKNYIFRLGFLDGREGFQCARMTARYTYLKYANLRKLKRG